MTEIHDLQPDIENNKKNEQRLSDTSHRKRSRHLWNMGDFVTRWHSQKKWRNVNKTRGLWISAEFCSSTIVGSSESTQQKCTLNTVCIGYENIRGPPLQTEWHSKCTKPDIRWLWARRITSLTACVYCLPTVFVVIMHVVSIENRGNIYEYYDRRYSRQDYGRKSKNTKSTNLQN